MSEFYASSATVEWYTPAHLVQAAAAVLGAIDCDPASNPPPYNVPAALHYTAADDGLSQPWRGRVFLNPPFGRLLPRFMAKLEQELTFGHVTAAITLTPDSTDTRWFRTIWAADAVCFTYGRISFLGAKKGGNTAGSVFAYWGQDPGRFARVFSAYGQVLDPHALVPVLTGAA